MNWDNPQFIWNNQLMINTNDGYFWAEGARDIIGGFHQEFDGSPTTQAISWLTAILYWITPFSLESIILYMPSILSSLIVVPIIFISRALGQLHVGFIAALFSSIVWSYYNRTMAGYYDTDMFNIVLPAFLLWSLVLAFKTRQDKYLLFMALDIILYRLWYPQSYSIEFAFFGLMLFYILVFERKNLFLLKLITIFLLAMIGFPAFVRILLVIGFYFVSKSVFYTKYVYHLLVTSFLLFLISGGFDPIWEQLKGYVFRDGLESLDKGLNLYYLSVMQTISEAGQIPFERFANRISGHIAIFFLSIIGFIWMANKFRVMLLALPLIGLGFLAYGIPGLVLGGGLRFTIYAIVPLAFGIAFIIVEFSKSISQKVKKNNKQVYYGLLVVSTVIILYPNIKHVIDYRASTVMVNEEVQALDALKKVSSREDYAIAWWDYGYPIRYYGDVKTLVDGGKHSGEVNFPVSLALTKPQRIAANISRLIVEAYEERFKDLKLAKEEKTNQTFIEGFFSDDNITWKPTFMQKLFTDNKLTSTRALFNYLDSDLKLPKKTRDIYYYLPFKMLNIYPVVESFSTRDLLTGIQGSKGFIRVFPLQNQLDRLTLSPNLYFSKTDGKLHQGNKVQPIKSFIEASYDKNKKIKVHKQLIDLNAPLHMIVLPSYGRVLLVDDKTLNSTYIQLFFLEQFDKRYFEPVILSPYAKIYKLKI